MGRDHAGHEPVRRPTDIVENDPPRKLVSKVKEAEIFRFVSRFVTGHHATMDGMLKTAATSFGEEPQLSGE